MTDGEAIVQLVNLYALAVDAKQWQLFERIFTEDVHAGTLAFIVALR
jgi:hypothetical protein